MNLAEVNLSEAQQWLETEHYERTSSCFNDKQTGDYCFLNVDDDCEGHNYHYCREYPYSLSYYNNLGDRLSDVGIICGGMYTAVGIYYKGEPIAKETITNMSFNVPLRSEVCCSYVSDDETDPYSDQETRSESDRRV